MLDFLTQWLRELILVIFFAVLLDMLLPNNAMQRYVKVVMGLLIVLIMLSPVLKLSGLSTADLDLSLDHLLEANRTTIKSLDQIEAQGEQLQKQNASLTTEQWKASIAAQIKSEVEAAHDDMAVSKVDVAVTADSNGKPQTIDAIRIYVAKKSEETAVQPVQPISPVEIGGETASQGAQAASSVQNALTLQQREEAAEVRNKIADEYSLSVATVHVDWQES